MKDYERHDTVNIAYLEVVIKHVQHRTWVVIVINSLYQEYTIHVLSDFEIFQV
jgi:hypothetical protein